MDDPKDTKYMVYKQRDKSVEELVKLLKSHLMVYTIWSKDNGRDMISYLSMSQEPEAYRRSSTMTLEEDSKVPRSLSKKKLTQSRATRNNRRLIDSDFEDSGISEITKNKTLQEG